VIAGVDWVTANHAPNAVANMSLGGGLSPSLNTAVANSIAAGVTYGIAAGNSNADACNYSPASTPAAITVGATTSVDAKASYSNYGTCVDINAPGSSITSSWNTSDIATNTISGTSMATPHVVGAAALYLSGHLGAPPSQVASALTGSATSGRLSGFPSGTPNLLLYTHFGATSPPPPPPSLTASFTKSCGGFSCTFTSTSQPAASITATTWTFSDGQTLSGTSVTRGFNARTNYTVTLNVTDGTSTATASGSVACNPRKCQ
jgi:subtilisin family serine protease